MYYKICPKCDSEYRITKQTVVKQETNEVSCKVCGNKLFRWKSSYTIYIPKLKVRRERHMQPKIHRKM